MQSTRPNYDEAFCGKLPLNQTNLIQPHGVFLLLSAETHEIIQASENCSALFNAPAEAVINLPLSTLIDENSYLNLKQASANASSDKLPVKLQFNDKRECLAILYHFNDQLILEIELPSYTGYASRYFVDVFQKLKQVMSLIDAATTIGDVCTVAATEIKSLSGFDKVMIYSFDEDWNGSVIAEAKEEEMEAYFGLKFPASDIPKPARDMYFNNPYRLIPNRNYEPVRLFPLLNPVTNTFTDLSGSGLRSVAGVHLEYLKNMGVTASMSTRIIHRQKLWGLISCHHRTAKYLSYEECQVFELLSNVISSRIALIADQDTFRTKEKLAQQFTVLVENIYKHDSLADAVENNKKEVMDYLQADGLYFSWNGTTVMAGSTPEPYEVEILAYWLQGKQENKVYHHAALPSAFDEAVSYSATASGVMSLPIQSEKGNFLILFRPEVIKTVSWGGNPNEALQFERGSSVYHPRNSFEQWREEVRYTSIPWQQEEVEAAEHFRNVLVEFALRKL